VEVIRRCEVAGHQIGRTALQKIPYFLGVRGVPLEYRFDLYHYGPFCQDILYDAGLLESLGAIEDSKGGYKGGSKYKAGANSANLLADHKEVIEKHSSTIDEVIALLAELDATSLEVVATIDYFYRYVSAMELPEPRKDEVLKRFFEAKKQHLDKRDWVGKMYDQMQKIGMVGI
ncbi:MAG: hypothetical protein JNM04_02040, partial [Chthonomonas sp.]|nr:hypothetical protein [Chthonomonas sp.]